MTWKLTQLAYGLLAIAGMLAAVALCFYVIWLAVMFVVSFVPIIGQKGRHDRWDELSARGREPISRRHNPRP